MKSCPTCNRTFEDTWTFCLADGTLLSAPFDPQATQHLPAPQESSEPHPTELMGADEQPPTEVMGADIPPPTQPAGGAADVPSTIASPRPQLAESPRGLAELNHAPAYSEPPRKKATLAWVVLIFAVGAVSVIFILSAEWGGTSVSNKSKSEVASSESPATPSPAPAVTQTPGQISNRPENTPQTAPQKSTPPPTDGQNDQGRAVEQVRAILRRNTSACQISQILNISAGRTQYGWRVTARVVMAASGRPITETLVWTVDERYKATPASQLTFEVGQGCF